MQTHHLLFLIFSLLSLRISFFFYISFHLESWSLLVKKNRIAIAFCQLSSATCTNMTNYDKTKNIDFIIFFTSAVFFFFVKVYHAVHLLHLFSILFVILNGLSKGACGIFVLNFTFLPKDLYSIFIVDWKLCRHPNPYTFSN